MKLHCKLLLFYIGMIVLLNSCMKDEPFKLDYIGFTPKELSDGWIISSPENENIDRQKLESAYELLFTEDRFMLYKSMLVIRNGKLIAEAYTKDPNDISRIENIQSVTKSITSILTGIALEKNILNSLNQTFYSIFPDKFGSHLDKKDYTIKQALSMSLPIDFNNSSNYEDFYFNKNTIEYVLSRPIKPELVNRWNYNDATPQLVSYAIECRYGKPLAMFAKEFLFDKLNITSWKWESARDGITFGAVSLYLKPRDMGKIGQRTWIINASTPVYDFPWMKYGYYFYIGADKNYPGGFGAGGHGGQAILWVPVKQLVVVITGWPYVNANEDYEDESDDLFRIIYDSCN